MSKDTMIGRVAAVNAAREGGEAQRAGKNLADCPYGDSPLYEEFCRHHWLKGYRMAAQA